MHHLGSQWLGDRGPFFCLLLRGEPGLCSADHGAGYFSNLACGWLGIDWSCPGWETENEPRTWQLLFCRQHPQTHFNYGKYRSLIQVLRIFLPKRPIYNKPALGQIMYWRWETDKRLSEAVTVLCNDACMRHLPRWNFESIIIFHTISRMFCAYVSWIHVDPFSTCNRPCFDLFWYHWLFCIGLWWPVVYLCAVRLLLLAPSPGAGEVTLLSGVGPKPTPNPKCIWPWAMSRNCNPMIERYLKYYVYIYARHWSHDYVKCAVFTCCGR